MRVHFGRGDRDGLCCVRMMQVDDNSSNDQYPCCRLLRLHAVLCRNVQRFHRCVFCVLCSNILFVLDWIILCTKTTNAQILRALHCGEALHLLIDTKNVSEWTGPHLNRRPCCRGLFLHFVSYRAIRLIRYREQWHTTYTTVTVNSITQYGTRLSAMDDTVTVIHKWFRSCDRNSNFFRDLILMAVSELNGIVCMQFCSCFCAVNIRIRCRLIH
jgi:hypothetical protein